MRVVSTILLLGALVATGCSSLHLDGRSAHVPIWTTEGDSPHRTSAVARILDPPLRQVWEFNAGAGFGPVSPLIVDDVALIATRKGEVHAIDMNSGKRLGQSSFGEAIDGTPTVENGILYVPVSWGGRALHAYNLSRGSTVWKVKGAPIEAGLIAHEDVLLAADVEGWVRAYDLMDGSVRWEVDLGHRVGVKAAPALVDGRLLVGDDRGHVTALDASSGSILWERDVEAPIQAPLAAVTEAVYVSTTRGRMLALSTEDGSILWNYEIASNEVYFSAPAVGLDEVVFGASDGHVRSLARVDGGVRWTTEVDGAVTATPLLTEGTVYVGTMRSRLVGLARSDGARMWETKLEGRIKSPFASSGTQLIVLAEPRHVYLFDVEGETVATRED